MSANTRPVKKVPKTAIREPGSPSGPMGLPVSYNRKDYTLKPGTSSGANGMVMKPVRRRASSAAKRYKHSKLLAQGPIE